MEKLFPTILIILDFMASTVYGFQGDVRKCIYWAAACALTVVVTY